MQKIFHPAFSVAPRVTFRDYTGTTITWSSVQWRLTSRSDFDVVLFVRIMHLLQSLISLVDNLVTVKFLSAAMIVMVCCIGRSSSSYT